MTLQEKREAKLNEIEQLLNSNEFSEERHKTLEGDLNAIEVQIRAKEAHEIRVNAVDKSHRAAPTAEPNGETRGKSDPEKEKRAYDLYLRKGRRAVEADAELRVYAPLNSTDETQGEFLIPVSTAPDIEKKQKSVGQMLTILRTINTNSGNTINWPTVDDTAQNGEFIDENAPVSQANPVFGHVPLASFMWSSKQVLVPIQLINDSNFDVQALLTEEFGLRSGRGFNARFTTGTDGILGVSGLGNLPAASSSVVDYTEPLTLQGNIDLAYDVNATYMFNKKIYLKYRALKSTTGQLLWQPEEYKAGLLHGRPFVINQDMPDLGISAKYLVYGDFSKYLFRRVGQMSVFRFNELFMSNLQQGFQAYQRISGKCIQPAAFATLTAASV